MGEEDLSTEDLQQLVEWFNEADIDGSGDLDYNEIKDTLKKAVAEGKFEKFLEAKLDQQEKEINRFVEINFIELFGASFKDKETLTASEFMSTVRKYQGDKSVKDFMIQNFDKIFIIGHELKQEKGFFYFR